MHSFNSLKFKYILSMRFEITNFLVFLLNFRSVIIQGVAFANEANPQRLSFPLSDL